MVSKHFLSTSILLTFIMYVTASQRVGSVSQARVKNTISPAQEADHYYWIQTGKNIGDDESWIQAGPKYLIETLPKMISLLESVNNKLEELVKTDKITIINVDGANVQYLIHILKDLQTTSQLLNVNHHNGNITIEGNSSLDFSQNISDAQLSYKELFLKNMFYFKTMTSHYYYLLKAFCYQHPLIPLGSLVTLTVGILGIWYFQHLKHLKKPVI
jgi:hypothetical protein